jgi:hypothetical protein
MMSIENGFTTTPMLIGLIKVDANDNQVQVLPTTSEVVTKESNISISQSFINQVLF